MADEVHVSQVVLEASGEKDDKEIDVSQVVLEASGEQTGEHDLYVSQVVLEVSGRRMADVYATGSRFEGAPGDVIPEQSDRAAWRVSQYPELHADDLADAEHTAHLPPPTGAGKILIDQGSAWESKAISGDVTIDEDGEITVTRHRSTADVSDPPTDSELDSAFGTPATLGRGFVGVIDDNDDNTDGWICWTSDISWYYIKGTKAV